VRAGDDNESESKSWRSVDSKSESKGWRERERERERASLLGNTRESRRGIPQRELPIQVYLGLPFILERDSTTKKTRSELKREVGEPRSRRSYLEGREHIRTMLWKANQNLDDSETR
jgi:hypothetical protein